MPKQEEFFGKSTKDCAEIADRYRKLMKEERELLSDLKKLQAKKQMLVKRSKQLRDDQVIKLNLDLQKEKAVRGDLEKKLGALEKKLNQLEKEIDARNREKHLPVNSRSSDSARNSKLSNAEIKLKRSKEEAEKRKDSKECARLAKESKSSAASSSVARLESRVPGSIGPETARQSNQTNAQSSSTNQAIAGRQLSNQLSELPGTAGQPESRVGATVSQSLPKRTTPIFRLKDVQLSKKTATGLSGELLPKTSFSVVGPVLPKTGHTETNTEPIEVIGEQTASLPKEQQLIRHNVKNVIRDLIARQSNPTTSNEPAGQSSSNIPTSQPKASAVSPSNTHTLSDSSTNVNYSPSSSDNSDDW